MDYLVVYSSEHQKIRLGSSNGDGGYVIGDGLNYNLLLGCGISDDISFETDFVKKYNVPCFAYDGTINNMPNTSQNITFVKKNIGPSETQNTTNLHDMIEKYNNIFLKMDIEGHEYQWLDSINSRQLNKISQIVIEFHFPLTGRFGKSVKTNIECLNKLAETHYLIHLHGNNCCGTHMYGDITVPNVFECTYIRKDLCKNIKLNRNNIPDPNVDKPNVAPYDDIHLSGYPFN